MVRTRLSIGEYHERYADTRGAEYWLGEVRFKSASTWLHSLLQGLLVQIFTEAGYASGSELDLPIDPEWEPKPDVAASRVVEEPYPSTPIDIAAEILSPSDSMDAVKEKCQHYARIGIRRIFVFDPVARKDYEWWDGTLELINDIMFDSNEPRVPLARVWDELDRRLVLGREGPK